VGGAVAPQPVRHQFPSLASLPLQKHAKEPFGRTSVTISLNQYVDHVPVLIHGPPETVPLAPDLHEVFVQMPHVTQPALATFQLSCVLRSELPGCSLEGTGSS